MATLAGKWSGVEWPYPRNDDVRHHNTRLQVEPLESRHVLAVVVATADPSLLSSPSQNDVSVLTWTPSAASDAQIVSSAIAAAPAAIAAPQAVAASISSLLYVGLDNSAATPTNSGLLMVADLASGTVSPVRAQIPVANQGYSGVAFDAAGNLFATTLSGPGSTSDLLRIDPMTGAVLSRVSLGISIGDLAIQPSTDRLFGIRSAHDGQHQAGQLYTISTSGIVTAVGNTGLASDGGLAFAPSGVLYFASVNNLTGDPELHTLDPATAAVLSTTSLLPAAGALGTVTGLAVRDSDGALIGVDSISGNLIAIDPATGARAVISLQAPVRGIAGDIAFPTAAFRGQLEQIYHENFEHGEGGYTIDNTGGTYPGLWHLSVGRFQDGLLDHTPIHSFYYGLFETPTNGGNYIQSAGTQGVIISPAIQIPACGTSIVSFSYVLQTRAQLDRDFVDVSVDNGAGITLILSRQDGTLPQTGISKWLTATADLSRFAGETIHLRFSFRTGDFPPVDPEGWFVDDVQIVTLCPTGTIAWEKHDAADNSPVGGATFTVAANPLDHDAADTAPLTVPDNFGQAGYVGPDQDPRPGVFRIDKAMFGTYVVTETVPPPGYRLDPVVGNRSHSVTVSAADPTPLSFSFADLANTMAWEKRDAAANSLLLAGATFTVTANPLTGDPAPLTVLDNTGQVGYVGADQDPAAGKFLLTKVLFGTYTVTETVPPPGYHLDAVVANRSHSVTVSAADPTPLSFIVADAANTMAWEKRDAADNSLLLAGATFTVTSNPLTGDAAPLTVLDNTGQVGYVGADQDPTPGKFLLTKVLFGTYSVTETIPPPGYHLDPIIANRSHSVTVSAADPTPLSFVVADLFNSIAWEKRDAAGALPLLGGATFTVTANPLVDPAAPNAAQLTVLDNTGEVGYVGADQDPTAGKFLLTKVLFGTYSVAETIPPPGYALDPTSRSVTVSPADPNPSIGTPGQSDASDFIDRPIADLSIQKDDHKTTATPGTTDVYTITVTNHGPQSVTSVILTDTVSTILLNPVFTPSVGSYNSTTHVWSGLTLAAGGSVTMTLSGAIDPAASGLLTNTVTVAPPPGAIDPDPTNNTATDTDTLDQTIQFITPMSVYRVAGPFAPGTNNASSFPSPPPATSATITGYFWSDVNQDGIWDVGEPARPGWRFFIDSKGDGVFDPVADRFAVTAADGSYSFTGLTIGTTYTVLSDPLGLSDGTFRELTFPAVNPAIQNRHGYQITVTAAAGVIGTPGVATVPNFGSFDYSPLVRPADQELDFIRLLQGQTGNLASVKEASDLHAAFSPWQSFTVKNTTASAFDITSIVKHIDTSTISAADTFVKIVDSSLAAVTFPIVIAPGQSVKLFAFYDPAVRNGATVTAQYPDWFGANSLTNPSHTFAGDDHLDVVTDAANLTYRVNLVGASTYDSDIFYDGASDRRDVGRLNDELLSQQWPILQGDARFDETSDINARFPNGAQKVVGTGSWPIGGPPTREIGNGDYAPLNIEFNRARAPFLDLNPDNSGPLAAISHIADNGAGLIRVTTAVTQPFATGQTVRVSGVSGASEANGTWIVTVVDSTHFDLQNSAFTAAYISGGVAQSPWGLPGVNYATRTTGVPVAIADADASFANSTVRVIASMQVSIINFLPGDQLAADTTGAPNIAASFNSNTGVLTLTGNDSVDRYAQTLRKITFSTSNATLRTVEIDVVATGSATAITGGSFTNLATPQAVANVANNGAGTIRVTTTAAHGFVTGQAVQISGVLGATEANGTWTVTVIDATHFDLQASTFTNAFTSGGSALNVSQLKGNTAVALVQVAPASVLFAPLLAPNTFNASASAQSGAASLAETSLLVEPSISATVDRASVSQTPATSSTSESKPAADFTVVANTVTAAVVEPSATPANTSASDAPSQLAHAASAPAFAASNAILTQATFSTTAAISPSANTASPSTPAPAAQAFSTVDAQADSGSPTFDVSAANALLSPQTKKRAVAGSSAADSSDSVFAEIGAIGFAASILP